MRDLLRKILDLLFPQSISVESVEALAREHHLRELPSAPPCPASWMHALFEYRNSTVRTLVWQIKYRANNLLVEEVGRLLSEEILQSMSDQVFFGSNNWVMVPIPASPLHKKEKGFNQTELMAKAVLQAGADRFLTYEAQGLQKVRPTRAQREIKHKEERKRNIHKSFKATEMLSGKNVVIIDDVITTGSTLEEARRALLEVGVREVLAFAIAH